MRDKPLWLTNPTEWSELPLQHQLAQIKSHFLCGFELAQADNPRKVLATALDRAINLLDCATLDALKLEHGCVDQPCPCCEEKLVKLVADRVNYRRALSRQRADLNSVNLDTLYSGETDGTSLPGQADTAVADTDSETALRGY